MRSLGVRIAPGTRLDSHDHPWPQVVYAVEGVLTLEAEAGAWVVPPHRAVWIPAATEHALEALGQVTLRTLYVHPRLGPRNPRRCRVLHVTPLLRELILEIVGGGYLDRRLRPHVRLAGVLVDRLAAAAEVPVDLPLPSDPRARRVADRVRKTPDDAVSLEVLSSDAGATARTLERLFVKETGLTFGRWRRHARLVEAIRRLGEGRSVTQVALDCGYATPSAFISMFKRELGTTPGRYFT